MAEPTHLASPEETVAARENGRRAARIVLLVAALLLLTMCAVRVAVSWHNDANMDHVSGVWTAMSQDLLHGVFYRPIHGPLGYGGTRYMPLFFVLQAGLWKALGYWRVAGRLITGVSIIAIVAGVYLLSRRFAASRALAFGAACVVLAGAGAKYALLDMRADGLAAALNLWGLVAVLNPRRRNLAIACSLFVMAFAAKVTTVFGVSAAVLWLFLTQRRRLALWLAAATAVGYGLVILLTNYCSDGRFLQILRATASGGGSNAFALGAPVRLAGELTLSAPDALLLALAVATLVTSIRQSWRTLPALFFATTLLVTLVIFGSPGTVGNHLIDLEIACVIAIMGTTSAVANTALVASVKDIMAFALATVMVIATLHYYQDFRDEDTEPIRADYAQIEDAVRATGKPVLAENPTIAIEAGQQPYVLDPFMFRVFAVRDPKIAQPLWDKLDAKTFGAVVLEYDPRGSEGSYVYESVHFGAPFSEHLMNNYEFVKQVGDLYVWKPKGASFPGLDSDR